MIKRMDPSIRNRNVKKWTNRSEEFKRKRVVTGTCYVIALLLIVGFGFGASRVLPTGSVSSGVPNIVLGMLIGALVGLVPFLIGNRILYKAKRKYGKPFVDRVDEFYQVGETDFRYGYHDVSDPDTDTMNLYEIPYTAIQSISIEDEFGIMTIIGKGRLDVYKDIFMMETDKEASGRKFYDDSSYQVMLSVENPSAVVNEVISKVRRFDI